MLVIDIDTKPGKVNGWESIFDLMEEYAPLPETTSGITPSGGMHLYHAMPKGEPPVEGGVAAERPHPVAGAGASVGQLISSICVPHEYRRQIIGPLPGIPRWALSHIRTRPRQTVVKHTGGSSRGPAASELPAIEWFIKNGFRLGQRQSRLPTGWPAGYGSPTGRTTIIIGTNEEPNIEKWDEAIGRRVIKIPSGH